QEPSYLGVYLAFAYPWILDIAEEKGRLLGGALVGALWMVAIFSLSKTALGALAVLTIIYALALPDRFSLKRVVAVCALAAVLGLALYVFGESLYEQNIAIWMLQYEEAGVDYSTVTRFGSQLAAIDLWLHNIVFGVGPGLSGAYLPDHYPSWMLANSNEIETWTALSRESLGAPTFSIYSRILAEYGLLGAGVGCGIFAVLISRLRRLSRMAELARGEEARIKIFLMSFAGCLIAFFGLDGIGFPGFWILLGCWYWMVESERNLVGFVGRG